ncbi:MAG: hypothetical protein IH616_04020 [Gemmatimonadales bacterium]|nr:hypothetical protein [Gemmatimonadales bacterium]
MKISRHLRACIMLLGLIACGGKEEDDEPGRDVATLESEDVITVDTVPMPEFPEARSGWLIANSAGAYDLRGEWEARAAMCDDPPVLEVLAERPGFGTLVLLQLPEPDARLTRYPIVITDSSAPQPPAAQIGVQLFQDRNSYAFQGLSGEVELYGFAERVSGRYAVTLREIQTDNEAKFVGVFDGIPIEALSAEMCLAMKEAMAASDSSDTPGERRQ